MPEVLLFAAAAPFEAAREVTILPEGHRSRRVHGHSFLAKILAALPEGWASFPGGEVQEVRSALERTVSSLDYQFLNQTLSQPTDENIARWIRSRMEAPGLTSVGVQSTMHEGAELNASDHARVWRRYSIQAAHRLPRVAPGHKCGRMHGHGFEIILHADQDLGSRPLGIDYDALDALWAPVHSELDYSCLNETPGLENPTSEMIASWLWHRLKPQLSELSLVTVYETAQCGANFDGQSYRIWKETTLDSAVSIWRAPPEDPRRRVHGHTYTLRLHLSAPMDTVMGWTIDFGDVKELFAPVFAEIDHHPLHELRGLEHADAASLARWIRLQAASTLPQIDRIDLYETRGCGVIYSWGQTNVALPI